MSDDTAAAPSPTELQSADERAREASPQADAPPPLSPLDLWRKVGFIQRIAQESLRRRALMQLSVHEIEMLAAIALTAFPVAQAAADWWATRVASDDRATLLLAEAKLEAAAWPMLDAETRAKVRRTAQ